MSRSADERCGIACSAPLSCSECLRKFRSKEYAHGSYYRNNVWLNWQCSEDLKDFLSRGKPVVAVTAGSVAPEERSLFAEYYQNSIASILACGAQVLVINAPEDPSIRELREDVLHLPFAPFSEVFPACTAVIHHGGIGTIAQCLRARMPSLVVPGGMGQP